MTFFNKKEDVIKIELTPHGRRLLSKGMLNPTYYTFLDDNIIYNPINAGIEESGVLAKDRILNETPYLKPPTNYKGVESSINALASQLSDNFNDGNLFPEKMEKLQNILGKAPITNKNASEISATFLIGEISSSALIYSGSGVAPVDIPQLECVVENELSVRFVDRVFDYGISNIKKPDGSFIEMLEGELLIMLKDAEGFNTTDNFNIEVFQYDETNDGTLVPMKMQKERSRIVDDILIDEDTNRILYEGNIYSNDYFTILFDDGINKENILVDLRIDCEDIALQGFEVDLYNSVTTNDDLEDC